MTADLVSTAPKAEENPQVRTTIDLVVPVYNEEHGLEASVRHLDGYLRRLPYPVTITIADNASTDDTWRIAERLASEIPRVRAIHLDEKGRGRALRAAWSTSQADVVGYMDVDLSTDLRALPPLLAPLLSGHSDLAIGTRLAHGSRIRRGAKRDLLSKGYNLLLRGILSAGFTDAQCGFKAIRRDVAEQLLPLVEDDSWFFDTELLVLASEAGLRIHEVPVDWVDDPDSRVDIAATVKEDLRGIARLLTGVASGRIDLRQVASARSATGAAAAPERALPEQLVRFAAVGVISTLAYVVLYSVLRVSVDAQAANLISLLVTAVANTAANRRLTFGITARQGAVRHHVAGLTAFGIGLALTSGSLGLLHWAAPYASHMAELSVLVLANATATLLRFVILRWVMRPRDGQ
ncbi:GtrA-like protein [Nocardioides albertanoniae]|uniref:GtrA-like protein n=1 Tax=Nocardioides albertanoniae TaxID=1175486 RepID=A0A543A0Z6_9ACTN|nr:glycosyltransferase [Nocardioides albertanoniae]TQL66255.1 GtrA-like protein [Nocardioides albertanoniae]